MSELPVKGLPAGDAGRLLIRLNEGYRDRIDRYGIARLTNNKNGKSLLVLVLGHDDDGAIYMPYDIRRALGIDKGGKLDFSIEKVGKFDKSRWYFTTPDPAVHVPAWIALIGIAVGALGVISGIAGVIVGVLSLK